MLAAEIDKTHPDLKPRILIVDDDATMRLLMSETLDGSGYIIDETDNGIDALRIIEETRPDLVLLDVRMPGMSGFDVCEKIRATSDETNIAIVMVTGLEDGDSIEKAYDLGATAFISKPINWLSFPYRIQYILKAREAFTEVQQREIQLQHLERITRIITRNSDIDSKLNDIKQSLLDIFRADRVIVVRNIHNRDDNLEAQCMVHHHQVCAVITDLQNHILGYDDDIFEKAIRSNKAILTDRQTEQADKNIVRQQMICALRTGIDNRHWYLIVQQCIRYSPWNSTDVETISRIGRRISNMLSNHLLMQKLHTNEKLLRQAQQIGHLGDWHWNLDTGKLSWSSEVFRIFGFEPDSFTPDFDEFYCVRDDTERERLKQIKHTAFNTNDTYDIVYNIHLDDGRTRWVHEHGIGNFDNDGKLREINGIVQDVTDRHKQQEQEAHDHKMDAIGQLTSGVAHDFGNLMTVAKGNLDLLDEIVSSDDTLTTDSKEMLADARSAVQDGVQLTKQLLAFSRKKSIAPEYIDVRQTIEQFTKLLKNTAGDSIQLKVDIQDNLADILVDTAQFESALLNLVINARNAMPNGGKILIIAEDLPNTSEEITRNPDNDIGETCVSLSVIDNGTGMDNEVLSHAIEPFFTTNKNDGTGLGLSMVYGFIRQSRGELYIDSMPEQGTCIQLQFPIYGGKSQTVSESTVPTQTACKPSTILIVEDRKTVRQFAVRCLSVSPFTILEADNATAAKDLLANNQVDLMFSDIIMPGDMNGRELAAWAIEAHPDLKILLTTASERQASQIASDITQTIPLLQKPYSRQELMDSVHDMLR